MNSDNLISLPTLETTETFSDAMSDLIRRGARQIIARAVETELQEFLGRSCLTDGTPFPIQSATDGL